MCTISELPQGGKKKYLLFSTGLYGGRISVWWTLADKTKHKSNEIKNTLYICIVNRLSCKHSEWRCSSKQYTLRFKSISRCLIGLHITHALLKLFNRKNKSC